jgi:hypothetical protein
VKDIEILSYLSWYYSLYERMSNLSQEAIFDSSRYDAYLLDVEKQKELVNFFVQDHQKWELEKRAFTELTGRKLDEAPYGVRFHGDEAFAMRRLSPDILLGPKDKILSAIKKAHQQHQGDDINRIDELELSKTPEGDDCILMPIIIRNKEILKRMDDKGGE